MSAPPPSPPPTPPATVQADSFLTLPYRLAGAHGDVVNTFGGQPATLSMGDGSLAAPLEQRLIGLAEGAHTTFALPAGEAFGAPNPAMRQWLKRSELTALGDPDEHYAVGDIIQLPTPGGEGQIGAVVRAVREDGALRLDFNHPLAGQPVTFEVHLIGVL